MCFFSAVFGWVSSNVSTLATIAAVIVAAIAARVATLQLRESSRATQVQVFDSTFNKLREREESYYTEKPKPDSLEKKHWLSGFFNTLEYVSFLINTGLIPEKLFIRFYRDAIIDWYENIFLTEADDEEQTDPKLYPELKQLYEHLKRKPGKPIWKKRPFR